MPKRFKAVLFDMGNVIVDFDFTPAFKSLTRHCPMKPHEINDFFLQTGLEVAYDGGKISSFEFYRHAKKGLGLTISYNAFKKIWNNIFTLKPRTARLITRLKKTHRLVLLSNTNAMHFDYLKVRYAKVLGQFDVWILSYKEKRRKPDARIYRTAAKACQARPEEIFYIDDRPDLTEAAAELGFESYTFRNDYAALERRLKSLKIL